MQNSLLLTCIITSGMCLIKTSPYFFLKWIKLNMKIMVNLSGKGYKQSSGVNGDFDLNDHDYLLRSMENVKKTDAKQLVFFTNISFVGFGEAGWQKKPY